MRARWVLVGGDTLLGKEVRELCAARKLPVDLIVAGTAADERVLTELEGEAAILEPLEASTFQDASAVLLAGNRQSSEQALSFLHGLKLGAAVVDVSGLLEELPAARLRAPLIEQATVLDAGIHVVAHPAALSLGRLLQMLHAVSPIRSCLATVFEPASERGSAGLEEMHQQSVSLFAFQPMPKRVFDAQATFNLLPRYGEEAETNLEDVEQRIEKHLAVFLAPRGIPMPSVRLLHAPVFHGYCQSVWVEFERRPMIGELEHALSEGGVDLRRRGEEPVSNVSVAGQSGLAVSDIRADRGNGRACWLWLASDNLRAAADNAVLIAALFLRQAEGRA